MSILICQKLYCSIVTVCVEMLQEGLQSAHKNGPTPEAYCILKQHFQSVKFQTLSVRVPDIWNYMLHCTGGQEKDGQNSLQVPGDTARSHSPSSS